MNNLKSLQSCATPAYVADIAAISANMEKARRIKAETGVKILLATKAFAMPAAFPIMRDYLDGTTASGEYEARLGFEDFGKEVHCYSPAYMPGEVERLTKLAHHIYFNSPTQASREKLPCRAMTSSCSSVGKKSCRTRVPALPRLRLTATSFSRMFFARF